MLNDDLSTTNILTTAGFVNKWLTKENSKAAWQAIMIHYVLQSRKEEMDDIRKGMNVIHFATFLKGSREFWRMAFPRMEEVRVTASLLQEKISFHFSVSNASDKENLVFQWCKQYVKDLPGKPGV